MLIIMYDAILFLCLYIINFNLKINFKEILKYKFVIMHMFNRYNLLFTCKSILNLQQISSNDA
jgi:hypothetical protein